MTRAAFLVVLLMLPPGPAAALGYVDLNRMIVDDVAGPAYRQLASRTEALSAAVDGLCVQSVERATVLNLYGSALEAWEEAQTVRTGPAFDGEVPSRIQYWPDKHGTGQRQLARTLATKPEDVLDPQALLQKSVALQGFPVLEQLLTSDTVATDDYACRFAMSVAAALRTTTAEVEAAWPAFARSVAEAGPGSAVFFSAYDPAAAFLKGIADSLDIIVQNKLERPLGDSVQQARPRLAESWRTERSLANIAATLGAARAMVEGENGYLNLALATGSGPPLAERVRNAFSRTDGAIRAIDLPLEAALVDPAARPKLETLVDAVKDLRTIVSSELGPAVGITVGFNALDGD